jgi:hypothetical protein
MKLNLGAQIDIAVSADVDRPLMVCSHERSGTHFLMNSIANSTKYTQEPFVNYDLFPLGASVNFFSSAEVNNFCKNIKNIQLQDQTVCTSSILKSHFPISLAKEALKDNLKAIYIYRNPVDTLISYWKFLHRWNWVEGPKTNTPLELVAHSPAGQSQRYQLENYSSYFERWKKHVSDAFVLSKNEDNLVLIRYSDLKNDYENTISKCCDGLSIEVGKILPPSKQDYIKGSSMDISIEQYQEISEYCGMRVAGSEMLPENIMSA